MFDVCIPGPLGEPRSGPTALHPPADMPCGDRMGTVEDPWGNEWYIASHLPEES